MRTRGVQQRAQNKRISHATGENERWAAKSTEQKDLSRHRWEREVSSKEHRTKGSLTSQVRTRGEQQRAQNKRISHATGENERCAAKSTEQKDLSCHRWEREVSSKEHRTKGSLSHRWEREVGSKEHRTKGSLTSQVRTRGEQQRAQNKRISHVTGENERCAAKSTEQKDLSRHRWEREVCSKEHRTKGSLMPQVRMRGVQQRAENKRISHVTGENERCAAKSTEQKDLSRHRWEREVSSKEHRTKGSLTSQVRMRGVQLWAQNKRISHATGENKRWAAKSTEQKDLSRHRWEWEVCSYEHRTKGSLTSQVRTRGEQQRAQNKRISHATGENEKWAAKSTEQKDLSRHRWEREVCSKEHRTKGSLMPQVRMRGVQLWAQNKRISHVTGENERWAAKSTEQKDLSCHRWEWEVCSYEQRTKGSLMPQVRMRGGQQRAQNKRISHTTGENERCAAKSTEQKDLSRHRWEREVCSKEHRTKGSLTSQVRTRGGQLRAENKRISHATGENERCAAKSTEQKDLSRHRWEREVGSKEHRTKGSLTSQVRTRGVQLRAQNKRISHATGENERCAAKSTEQKDLSRHRWEREVSSKEQRTKGSLTSQVRTRGGQQRAQNKRISHVTGENERWAAKSTEQKDLSCHRWEWEVCSYEHRTKGSLTPQVRTRGVQQRAQNKRISHVTGENERWAAKSTEQKDLSCHRWELEVSSKEHRTKGSLTPQVRTRGGQLRAQNKRISHVTGENERWAAKSTEQKDLSCHRWEREVCS